MDIKESRFVPNNLFVFSPMSVRTTAQSIVRRVHAAFELCWGLEDHDVIYLTLDQSNSDPFRSILQALGLTVFGGTNAYVCRSENTAPLILVNMVALCKHSYSVLLDDLTHSYPDATICVLTGYGPELAPDFTGQIPEYDDARAVLQAAGIGFFSVDARNHG